MSRGREEFVRPKLTFALGYGMNPVQIMINEGVNEMPNCHPHKSVPN